MLFLPDGSSADKMDPLLVLAFYAREMMNQGEPILFAGLGNPSYPAN